MPYKQDIMDCLVDIDPAAKAIGAVNTLVRTDNGYKGYNTDMSGLARAIMSEGMELKNKKIIILGAGGASRAVAYMCMEYGADKVYILNRTYDKASSIADDMNSFFGKNVIEPVEAAGYKDIPKDNYMFIQCTSVGLKKSDGLPVVNDREFFSMAKEAVDLIYNPAKTCFLKLAEAYGAKCMNGLKMLLYQGIMAYELWNGIKVSDELTQIVYRELCESLNGIGARDNIILVGYMGAGKTTVGKKLSEHGYKFIDTDEYIVDYEKMSINDIFSRHGEKYFRDLETKVLNILAENTRNTVISTGGGLPLRKENEAILKNIGRVIYLKADADTIYERVKRDTKRPLLAGDDPYKKICDMLVERTPRYEAVADIIIDTREKNTDMIAREILEKI